MSWANKIFAAMEYAERLMFESDTEYNLDAAIAEIQREGGDQRAVLKSMLAASIYGILKVMDDAEEQDV